MTVNADLLDDAVRHSIELQRYSNGVVRKVIALLNRVDKDLVAQIKAFDPDEVTGKWSEKRIEKMLAAIKEINAEAYKVVTGDLADEVKAFGEYEAEFQVSSIKAALPVQMGIIAPTTEQIYAATMARPFQGRILKDWGKDLEASAFAKVRDAIRQGFVEGETIDQMVRRIRGTRARQYQDGILQINRRNAESVVRTAVSHTASVARQEVYKANADVVKGWVFVATLDSRTTLTCASLDRKEFKVGEGPMPPRHFGCRSASTPRTASWRELGFDIDELPPSTRASMDGQVPATETYGSWLKKRPADFQDSVLGPERAKLFREGGLKIDRFTDASGDAYTLDELRKREREAFNRAGL